jgi:hypothetical protein
VAPRRVGTVCHRAARRARVLHDSFGGVKAALRSFPTKRVGSLVRLGSGDEVGAPS